MLELLAALIMLLAYGQAHGAPAEYGGDLPYNLHLMELREVTAEGYKIINNRDEYFPYQDPGSATPGEHWDKGMALGYKLNIIRISQVSLYLDQRVHGEFTDVQARQVGLQYEAGLRYQDYIDFYWDHDSEHALDQSKDASGAPRPVWPLRNFVGCRITLYKAGR